MNVMRTLIVILSLMLAFPAYADDHCDNVKEFALREFNLAFFYGAWPRLVSPGKSYPKDSNEAAVALAKADDNLSADLFNTIQEALFDFSTAKSKPKTLGHKSDHSSNTYHDSYVCSVEITLNGTPELSLLKSYLYSDNPAAVMDEIEQHAQLAKTMLNAWQKNSFVYGYTIDRKRERGSRVTHTTVKVFKLFMDGVDISETFNHGE